MSKAIFLLCFTTFSALYAQGQQGATNLDVDLNPAIHQARDSHKTQQDSAAFTYPSTPREIRQIDQEELQKYKDDQAFNYEVAKVERTWWDDFTTWLGNLFRRFFEWIFGVEKASSYWAVFLELLPYLLLGVLLYLLIRFFLNVNASGLARANQQKGSVSLSEEENLIKNENLQQLIQKALADKNYRLAIRYYYLHLLKLMTEKDIIAWELQKTNEDYLREIQRPDLKPSFVKITRWYDYIWYGAFPLDESGYYKAEKAFTSLKNNLNGNG